MKTEEEDDSIEDQGLSTQSMTVLEASIPRYTTHNQYREFF